MLTKTITYTDYNGKERTEEFHFHLSKADLIRMQHSAKGGLDQFIERITKEEDNVKQYELFEEIILKAYGKKDIDGIRFIRSKEMSEAFSQTEAYAELIFELMSSPETAAAFFKGIIPANLEKAVN